MSRARTLGAALLLLVCAVHFGYDPLADAFYGGARQAARAIFYIARGIEGAALYVIVWAYAPRSSILTVACAWGAFENAQTAICRAAIGVGQPADAAAFRGLCDAGGVPVYQLTAIAMLFILAMVQEARE